MYVGPYDGILGLELRLGRVLSLVTNEVLRLPVVVGSILTLPV